MIQSGPMHRTDPRAHPIKVEQGRQMKNGNTNRFSFPSLPGGCCFIVFLSCFLSMMINASDRASVAGGLICNIETRDIVHGTGVINYQYIVNIDT